MSGNSRAALLCTALILLAGAAQAQIDDDKEFNLATTQVTKAAADTAATQERYDPRIEPGKFELGLTLGFLGLNTTILQHDQMIYKATSELFYYADVDLGGKSAFTPFLDVAYNLKPFLALEAKFAISFSDYEAKLTNVAAVNPEGGLPTHDVEISPYDAERRACMAVFGTLGAVLYPLNLSNEGRGRWHPYLTAGVGGARYDIDSNYTDDAATAFNTTVGGGIRFIADELISLRFEVLQLVHTVEFTPAQYFDVSNDGTVTVPVYEFETSGRYSEVESFESQALGGLAWSFGIVASF